MCDHSPKTVSRLGYLAISAAAVLWAAGGTLASALADRGASPIEMTESRAWIAVAGTGAILLARRRRAASRRGRLDARFLALLIPFGLTLGVANASYYVAVSALPVAVAIVIQYTAPGIVVLWTALQARRPPSTRVLGALVLVLAGVVLLSQVFGRPAGGRLDPAGLAAAAVSALSFAAYVVLGEKVGRRLGAERSVFYGFVVAGSAWILVQAVRGRPDTLLDPSFLPGLAFLGVFATIVPFLLFLWGLGRVDASRAGIASTLEPLAAALLAYLLLDQTLAPVQLLGGAMVVAGIGVVQADEVPSPEVLAERAVAE